VFLFSEFEPKPVNVAWRNNSLLQQQLLERQRSERMDRIRNSGDVLAKIGELVHSLSKQVASKSSEIQRLNDLVDGMQVKTACGCLLRRDFRRLSFSSAVAKLFHSTAYSICRN